MERKEQKNIIKPEIIANHITTFAEQIVSLAQKKGKVTAEFNDIMLTADRESSVQNIIDDYRRKVDEGDEQYYNSPKGKRAALEIEKLKEKEKQEKERRVLESEKRTEEVQRKHDELMQQLPNLDFANYSSVLNWLCEFQDPSRQIGVVKRQSEVLDIFAKHGYQPLSEAADNESSDAESRARYIISRALDDLKSVAGAIHPAIHKFAKDWKKQFKA
ncbi:MAG: hypothetical protein WC831_05275 [Parcubacteria group bacterium]|jgi:hypothetical protein